jgi:hypothetical protein
MRYNGWRERRKAEGPKKIAEVHAEAAEQLRQVRQRSLTLAEWPCMLLVAWCAPHLHCQPHKPELAEGLRSAVHGWVLRFRRQSAEPNSCLIPLRGKTHRSDLICCGLAAASPAVVRSAGRPRHANGPWRRRAAGHVRLRRPAPRPDRHVSAADALCALCCVPCGM